MSSFCVSTDETHSSEQGIFFSCQTDWKNKSYLTEWHTKGFWNFKLVYFYLKSVSHKKPKCLHFCVGTSEVHSSKCHFFSHSKQNEKMSHIWHNGIPGAFRILIWFLIIQSQWTVKIPTVFILRQDSFFHSVWNERKMAGFEPCISPVLMQNQDIWHFYSSLTLHIGELIWYSW